MLLFFPKKRLIKLLECIFWHPWSKTRKASIIAVISRGIQCARLQREAPSILDGFSTTFLLEHWGSMKIDEKAKFETLILPCLVILLSLYAVESSIWIVLSFFIISWSRRGCIVKYSKQSPCFWASSSPIIGIVMVNNISVKNEDDI